MPFCWTGEIRTEHDGYWEGVKVGAEMITTPFSEQFSRLAAMWLGDTWAGHPAENARDHRGSPGRDSSRLFSTSTGLIMAPRLTVWEMLPANSPLYGSPLSFDRPLDKPDFFFLSFFFFPVSFHLCRSSTFEFVFVNGTFGRLIDVGNVSFIYDVPLTSSWLGIFVSVSRPYRRTQGGQMIVIANFLIFSLCVCVCVCVVLLLKK